jgi:hypothetical protein
MDSDRFDDLIRQITATRLTRASALHGLAGGLLAAVAGGILATSDTTAKPGKKRKRRKAGRNRGRNGRLQTQKGGPGNAGKVTICHFTGSETNPYNIISVSANALPDHEAHGDFRINDDDGCCVDADCTEFPNSFCDTDAGGGAQCACEPTPRDEACAGHCNETVGNGCAGSWNCTCCSPQICSGGNCVIPCGASSCNPNTHKCCPNLGSADGPVCVPYDTCCTFGVLGVCLSSTNESNKNHGQRPWVEKTGGTDDSVTLLFHQPASWLARFEVRIDGARRTCGSPHLVVSGDFIYPGPSLTGPTTREVTYTATQMVEVRLALGGERDADFENTQSGWIAFPVGP